MLEALEGLSSREVSISEFQMDAVGHESGPLWIVAGPGSGKTEALVLSCLKLLLVDRADPHSVMVTTFTEKAGRNLQDRLLLYTHQIERGHPWVKDVDLTQLRVGTLHSLCNDILIEYRFPKYRNFRPMDDMQQLLFIYFHSDLAKRKNRLTMEERDMFSHFRYMFDVVSQRKLARGDVPSRWARARVCQSLFNRIVEYRLDVRSMEKKGEFWKTLAHRFLQYEKALEEWFRVDFAHMQSKLLDFLATPQGELFITGGAKPNDPGLHHVLVDEYQDTNPIQAEIYFELARKAPHNLVVVGDEDQALYRFRGGTVESMIAFDEMCRRHFGKSPKKVALVENYRSHPGIVQWCNDYIASFKTMGQPSARIARKPPLVANSSIRGKWPAVKLVVSDSDGKLADAFASMILHFEEKGLVQDYSDCVLLIHSTRESRRWAGPYAQALEAKRVPVYNPRARQFLEEREVKLALGALLMVIDEKGRYPLVPDWTAGECEKWRQFYLDNTRTHPRLHDYVRKAAERISKAKSGNVFNSSILDVFYHIVNQDPFTKWCEDSERAARLGYLSSVIDAYVSTPIPGKPEANRGVLRASRQFPGEISWWWRHEFYNALVTLMVQQGMNDPEDTEIVYPKGAVPFMTVHQAKGLEFPVVFVARVDERAEPSYQHIIEEETDQFRKRAFSRSTADQRAREDLIRFYYVAYSRARYALILLLRSREIRPGEGQDECIGLGGGDFSWLKNQVEISKV